MKKLGYMFLATFIMLTGNLYANKDNQHLKDYEKKELAQKKALAKKKNNKKKDEKKQSSTVNKQIINSLQKEVFNLWGQPNTFNGTVSMSLIIDVSSGDLATFFIYKRIGDEEFLSYFKDFVKEIKSHKFHKYNIENPLIEMKINLIAKAPKGYEPKNKYTLLDKEDNVYKDYLRYLLSKKGLSKKILKEILQSKRDSFEKSMLFGIYYGFEKKNPKNENKYFTIVVNRFPEKLKETKDGLIVADWLLKQKQYDFILKLFPERSCQFFAENDDKRKCYYYKAISKYKKGLDYELEMGIARNYFKAAEEIARKGEEK